MSNAIGDFAKKNESIQFSASLRLTSLLIDKRNQMLEGQTGAAAIAIKVVGELGFVALAIISIIETIVRGILGIVIGVPLDCFTDNAWAFPMTGLGALFTAANTAVCFMALKENFSEERDLDYGAILPCVDGFAESGIDKFKSWGFKG